MTRDRTDRTLRYRDLWLAAGVLPAVPACLSIAAAVEPSRWLSTSLPLVRALTPDALLYSAACVVIAAPLAGVAVASSRRAAPSGRGTTVLPLVAPLVVATAIFCAVSGLLTYLRLGPAPGAAAFVWTSHAALASVTLALAALGALCGTLFRDPLDAAACSLAVSVTTAAGLLVAGAPVAYAPPGLVRAAFMASPLLTIASAANVDIVRTDILYQISPLAHVQVVYPTWMAVCGWYLLAGFTGFLGLAWTHRKGRYAPALKGLQ